MMNTFSMRSRDKNIELLNTGTVSCVIGYANDPDNDYPMQALISAKDIDSTNAKEVIQVLTKHFNEMGWLGDTND